MSRRNNRQQLDLKLNLSPPRGSRGQGVMTTSPETSPPSSCVSSEESLKYSSSPEATSMVVVGCPRCLMYVMLSESDPKCPKCKSTVLLDFLRDDANNHTTSTTKKKSTTRN
ncbi:Protein GL2-INTERACTING REPRESSOR 1 [Dionaea muscipula]